MSDKYQLFCTHLKTEEGPGRALPFPSSRPHTK